jgi:DNA-binding XRE family transcriptional regulator
MLGWTQNDLAERARINRRTVVNIESGKHTPTPSTLLSIQRQLMSSSSSNELPTGEARTCIRGGDSDHGAVATRRRPSSGTSCSLDTGARFSVERFHLCFQKRTASRGSRYNSADKATTITTMITTDRTFC